MKNLLKKFSQIVLVHTEDVFIALYPFGKWSLSKEVSVFMNDGLVQVEWYIGQLQIGVWHSVKNKEVRIY